MKNIQMQYPKLILLLISIVTASILFRLDVFKEISDLLNGYGYWSMFIGGILFAYGFTAAFGVGLFASIAPEIHPLTGALVGGLGSLFSDLLLFHWIRSSFQDEFDRLMLTRVFQWISRLFHHHVQEGLKPYLLWSLAGFLIASPLPDEFGVSLISAFTSIDEKKFMVVDYLLNSFGIFVIVLLSSSV